MKVMVIVKASPSSEAGVMPDAKLLEQMNNFNKELINAGIMQSGDGLKPSKEGFRVRFDGDNRIVTNGPFTETNELIAGYWVWNVDSLEQAMEWVKKCPKPMPETSDIEVRPFFEQEDFEEISGTEEVLKNESATRKQLDMRASTLNSYLFFDGCCEEAIAYYQAHLGAVLKLMMRFDEAPEPIPAEMLPSNHEDKVMHAEFLLGNSVVYASDGCGTERMGKMQGCSQSLTVNSAELAHHAFNALADGGEINMPLEETFWSELYGQVTDKFGVQWMIMVEEQQGEK